jgi:hypothetical protein
MAAFIWSLNVLGFSFGIIVLVAISPNIIRRLGLAEYAHRDSYIAFKQQVPKDNT